MNKSQKIKWVIDCDPGCDDAVALGLAASELSGNTVEVLTAAGNVNADLTAWNASRVISACRVDWPVYRGSNGSLSGESVPAASVHGRDGLGDVSNNAFGIRPRAPESESAVRRLVRLSDKKRQFVLVCTGPLTNLASALNLMTARQQASFWRRCQICVVMGGVFQSHGNITASAEFNTHFDPVAVHVVLESWRTVHDGKGKISPIHFVPLDMTEEVGLPLHNASNGPSEDAISPAAKFILPALRKYGLFHSRYCRRPKRWKAFGIEPLNETDYFEERVKGKNGLRHLGAFCFLHDPLAMWIALNRGRKDFATWWSDAQVRMDISHGVGRGRLIMYSLDSAKNTPSRAQVLGTRVKWLDPKKFSPICRTSFVGCIKKLLGIPTA